MRGPGSGHVVAVTASDPALPKLVAADAELTARGFRTVAAPGVVVAWDPALASAEEGGTLVVSRAPLATADTHRPVSLQQLAAALARGGALRDMCFAAPATVTCLSHGQVTLCADPAAQGQICWATRDGIAVAGSSSALVAALCGAELDTTALAGLALVGTGVLLRTLFNGVQLLDLGESVALSAGQATVKRNVSARDDNLPVAGRLRASVAGAVTAHPDAEIELSGGFDSRILLAAMPPELRRGRGALTLGSPNAPDVVIAARLAQLSGLHHRVVHPAMLLGSLSPIALLDRLLATAMRDEFALNPLDRLLFGVMADVELAAPARFSGQNGEILRGFYYAGQPIRRKGTTAMARRLVAWRMLANDRADPRLFRPGWLADHETTVVDALAARLAASPGADWGSQLDAFYLAERMHRWCGGAVSSAMSMRTILLPFFEPGVIAHALATSPRAKAGGRLAARLIAELEPAFATVPFDHGLTPAQIAAAGPGLAVKRFGQTIGKTLRKVRQRVARSAASTVGSGTALELFRRHALHRQLDLEPAYRLGVFSPERLDAIASGQDQPDRATLAVLLNACALGTQLAR